MAETKKPKINKRLFSVLLAVMILIATLAVGGMIAFAALTDYQGNALNSSTDKQVDSVIANGNYQIGDARSMLQLINKMRTGKDAWYWNADNKTKTVLSNVGTLKYDYALEQIAMRRAAELVLSFAHQRPDGTLCFDLLYDGVDSWGENIAYCYGYGDTTTQLIFDGWAEENYGFEGQGHRRNMLNPNFTAVGIACFKYNGTQYWVQEFSYSTSKISDPINTFYAAPKLSSATAASNGITVKWGAVAGATKYRVFYKANGESTWHKAGDTTSASYTWTGAKYGVKYTFTVRCVDKDGKTFTSPYNKTGVSYTLKLLDTPKLSSVSNAAAGVKVSWGKVLGAEKYRVFYKANGESTWHKAGDTASTSFTWAGAKNNTKYTFTVRCIDKNGNFKSAYNSTGKSITFLSAPTVSVSNAVAGVKVSWKKVSGAVNYAVYRKTPGGSYAKIGTTTGTSFTDKNAKNNTKYVYTVRCASKDGKSCTSSYNAGKSITFLSAPTVSVSNAVAGVKVSWKKVSGAVNYAVFRKTPNGSYKRIATTTGTSFTDKNVKNNTKYVYTVRCISKDGKTTTSSYNTGKSITR